MRTPLTLPIRAAVLVDEGVLPFDKLGQIRLPATATTSHRIYSDLKFMVDIIKEIHHFINDTLHQKETGNTINEVLNFMSITMAKVADRHPALNIFEDLKNNAAQIKETSMEGASAVMGFGDTTLYRDPLVRFASEILRVETDLLKFYSDVYLIIVQQSVPEAYSAHVSSVLNEAKEIIPMTFGVAAILSSETADKLINGANGMYYPDTCVIAVREQEKNEIELTLQHEIRHLVFNLLNDTF